MCGETHEMTGKTSPLIANSRFFVNGLTGGGGLLVGMAGSEQGDHRFLSIEIHGIPFRLFGREFSADVEGARDVHGFMIERAREIEDYKLILFDFVTIGEVMDGVDVAS